MYDVPWDLLQAVLKTLADGIVVHDSRGRLLFANDMAARLVGYASAHDFIAAPAGEALGRFELLDEEGAPLAADMLPGRGALADGEPTERVIRYRPRDSDEERWSRVAASPIKDADGKVQFVVSSFRDITNEVHARTEAEQAAERQAFLVEASHELASSLDYEATLATVANLAVPRIADWCTVDILDDDGHIRRLVAVHFDPAKLAYAEELGRRYPIEEYPPQALITGQPELYPELTDEMLAALELEEDLLQIIRDLGLHSAMNVPLIARGRTLGVLSLVAAESGRRYTTDDLAFAEQLAQRAALAVDNARLYQQAVHALSLRDEFLAVAAHELKTPLTALQLSAELLLRTLRTQSPGGADAQDRLATRIYEQSGKLTRLVVQLLDVSRIEAGRLRLNPEQTDLARLLHGAVESTQRADDQLTFSVQAPAELWAVVDATRIEQVLVNLLDNARKFSPSSAPIEVVLSQPEPETALVTVRDHGRGIAPEHLPHIFERFYQVDPSQAAAGMGLGLFISRQIVELHGGGLDADSPPDGGARFVVRLPVSSEQEGRDGHESDAVSATP